MTRTTRTTSASQAAAARGRAAVCACAVIFGVPIAAPSEAPAASAARICGSEVALRDSPRGFTIGYLSRGDRVRVLTSRSRAWVRVSTPLAARGWIERRRLCR